MRLHKGMSTARVGLISQSGTGSTRLIMERVATGRYSPSISTNSTPYAINTPKPGSPRTPLEWMAKYPEKVWRYKGEWVALTRSGVIAHANDFDRVYSLARSKGVLNPLVFRVPLDPSKTKIVSARR